LYAYIGITPFNNANGWNINHNVITRPPTPAGPSDVSRPFTGIAGVTPYGGDFPILNTTINQNKIQVQGQCPQTQCPVGYTAPCPCGIPVPITACGSNNDMTTVAYNDFRGSDFRTIVYALNNPTGTPDDKTGLGQFEYGGFCGPGRATNITVLGNLSTWDPNRGTVSGSNVSPSAVLPHMY
jgi:hypothetical protein